MRFLLFIQGFFTVEAILKILAMGLVTAPFTYLRNGGCFMKGPHKLNAQCYVSKAHTYGCVMCEFTNLLWDTYKKNDVSHICE
jgi:hypothetical protein